MAINEKVTPVSKIIKLTSGGLMAVLRSDKFNAAQKSAAAKEFARRRVSGTVKKAAPKKAAKVIKTELKAKGLKMPHGYGVETRARVTGSDNMDELNHVGKRLIFLENEISAYRLKLKLAPPAEKIAYRIGIENRKKQFSALKKYLNTLARFRY
jgi:hypothetical protein